MSKSKKTDFQYFSAAAAAGVLDTGNGRNGTFEALSPIFKRDAYMELGALGAVDKRVQRHHTSAVASATTPEKQPRNLERTLTTPAETAPLAAIRVRADDGDRCLAPSRSRPKRRQSVLRYDSEELSATTEFCDDDDDDRGAMSTADSMGLRWSDVTYDVAQLVQTYSASRSENETERGSSSMRLPLLASITKGCRLSNDAHSVKSPLDIVKGQVFLLHSVGRQQRVIAEIVNDYEAIDVTQDGATAGGDVTTISIPVDYQMSVYVKPQQSTSGSAAAGQGEVWPLSKVIAVKKLPVVAVVRDVVSRADDVIDLSRLRKRFAISGVEEMTFLRAYRIKDGFIEEPDVVIIPDCVGIELSVAVGFYTPSTEREWNDYVDMFVRSVRHVTPLLSNNVGYGGVLPLSNRTRRMPSAAVVELSVEDTTSRDRHPRLHAYENVELESERTNAKTNENLRQESSDLDRTSNPRAQNAHVTAFRIAEGINSTTEKHSQSRRPDDVINQQSNQITVVSVTKAPQRGLIHEHDHVVQTEAKLSREHSVEFATDNSTSGISEPATADEIFNQYDEILHQQLEVGGRFIPNRDQNKSEVSVTVFKDGELKSGGSAKEVKADAQGTFKGAVEDDATVDDEGYQTRVGTLSSGRQQPIWRLSDVQLDQPVELQVDEGVVLVAEVNHAEREAILSTGSHDKETHEAFASNDDKTTAGDGVAVTRKSHISANFPMTDDSSDLTAPKIMNPAAASRAKQKPVPTVRKSLTFNQDSDVVKLTDSESSNSSHLERPSPTKIRHVFNHDKPAVSSSTSTSGIGFRRPETQPKTVSFKSSAESNSTNLPKQTAIISGLNKPLPPSVKPKPKPHGATDRTEPIAASRSSSIAPVTSNTHKSTANCEPVASKWNSLADVPADIDELSVADIGLCATFLGLDKRDVNRLTAANVDGRSLKALTASRQLAQRFPDVGQLDASKLMRFARGWRPQ